MTTNIPAARLTQLRAEGAAADRAAGPFVDPSILYQATRVLDRRGEAWAATILGRDISRRSLAAPHRPWLRQTAPGMLCGIPLKESIKARSIGALGAAELGRRADREGLRTNRRLLGVYGFDGGRRRYADLLQNWLFNARDGDLLMCHPAKDARDGGAMARQRRAEYDVLACPKLGDWMLANGVRISRLPSGAR